MCVHTQAQETGGGVSAHVHTQAQEIGGGAQGHEGLPRSCRRSYCSAARRQENQETGDRDQTSRRDQRSKL